MPVVLVKRWFGQVLWGQLRYVVTKGIFKKLGSLVNHKASAKKVQKDGGRKKNSRGGAGGLLRRSKRSHMSPKFPGGLFTGYNKWRL